MDYNATAALLRFGRKNDGPWEDGNVPHDGDTNMIISSPQITSDYAALKSQYEDLIRIVRNIEIHFEQLCSDELSEHGAISTNHGIDFKVFRTLCGYAKLMEENATLIARHNALRDAVANTLIIYDRMAPSLKDHIAARAEVDRLLEEK